MVYLVERYLPGLSRADLELALERLGRVAEELQREGTEVRYLGSTIVPADEACFCQFEAPSRAVVEELNERAKLRFDRIVSGVVVPKAQPSTDKRATP
jgi:Protein of unknown function (DUF4242)